MSRSLARSDEPRHETRADLELIDEHRLTGGVVCLRYRVQQ
jgi:hypothetical protein